MRSAIIPRQLTGQRRPCYTFGMNLSRRKFLQWSSLAFLSACGARVEPSPPAAATSTAILPPPDATGTPFRGVTTLPGVAPSATPAATATRLATSPPAGSPIKHVVIFVQENHSFDSLFAGFAGADGIAHGGLCQDQQPDPPHNHLVALLPNGLAGPNGDCHYSEAATTNYWKLARAFTLCDHYHSEARGPSEPNYFMLTAAQSPIVDNLGSNQVFDMPALPNRLMEKGLSWGDYGGIMNRFRSLRGRQEIVYDQTRIIADAHAGRLANVSWLFSEFDVSGHPPASMCAAENWMVRVLNALMHGPQWESMAVFVTWDEWGGFYDHAEPPLLEREMFGTPVRVGQRVPCTVVSPYAKAGNVSHQFHSHISLLKFAETIFDLKPLTNREAQVDDMLDCFDFSQKPRAGIDLVERKCG